MILVETNVAVEVAGVRVKRDRDRIVLVHPDWCVGGAFEDWREIIKQVSALLEPAKVEAAPKPEADPRGYVFIDGDGDAWGYFDHKIKGTGRRIGRNAMRPFATSEEATKHGQQCVFGCHRVEVWTPESGVPPMPEKQP